ncbi:MAG: FHA domain-containing protein [Gemmataceae bacterium]|nr:FHA domain-containing protein [Gemmataceae bacterium]
MNLRWFLYFCAIWGAVGGLAGWGLGRLASLEAGVGQASFRGLCLGLALGFVLALVDAAFNGFKVQSVVGAVVGGFVGALGGFVGGALGQLLYGNTLWAGSLVIGWTLTGLLIGAAPGMFGFLASLSSSQDAGGDRKKVLNGVIGGTVGGLLGGVFYLLLANAWRSGLGDRAETMWSPSATGFVILGACIGLLIALAQVILKEAWVKVEAGFRAGREMILTRAETTVGRGEGCDIALFGDATIEKTHARIVSRGGRYLLEDNGTPGGTFVNGEEVAGPRELRDGDRIQVGKAVLRFRGR